MRLVLFVYNPDDAWDVQRRELRVPGDVAAAVGGELGRSVLLCERLGQVLQYFALGQLVGHRAAGVGEGLHTLELRHVAYLERAIRVENTGGSAIVRRDSCAHEDGDRAGWISEAEFARLARAGGLSPDAREAHGTLMRGLDEQQNAFRHHPAYDGIIARPDEPGLEARTLAAYDYRCAVSGTRIFNRTGTQCDAVALPIPGADEVGQPDAVNGMICLSPTWAFLMRSGLMGIAGDYTLRVKDALIPDVVLAQLPPNGTINLPENAEDWPDAGALARHCGTFFS